MRSERYEYVATDIDATVLLRIDARGSGLFVYSNGGAYATTELTDVTHPWPHGVRALVHFMDELHRREVRHARDEVRAAIVGASRHAPYACGIDWVAPKQRPAALRAYVTLAQAFCRPA